MTAVEYVLEGLEAALELERELGVRTVEVDRRLLEGEQAGGSEEGRGERLTGGVKNSAVRSSAPPDLKPRPSVSPAPQPRPSIPTASPSQPETSASSRPPTVRQLVFLHDRPLSEKGVEMMAKILTAMGLTVESAPIVVAPPLPKAKIVVVLGGLALKKYFPEMHGGPGQWQRTPEGCDVLITYSPEYILRFATVTPAVRKIKQDMWHSLKAVVQRCRQG